MAVTSLGWRNIPITLETLNERDGLVNYVVVGSGATAQGPTIRR